MATMLSLIGLSGAHLGKTTVFSARSTTIGSAPGCGVVMQDHNILPRHAELRITLGHWFIVPLDAKATVLVNGAKVQSQQRVNPGDLVTLGSTTFKAGVGEAERAIGATRRDDPVPGADEIWHD